MENASKALLIAGAILISILLISIGIFLINSNAEVTSEAGSSMDTAAIQMFNNKFLTYLSNSASGTTAKSLTTKIIQHNATTSSSNKFSPDDHHIYLNFYPKSETSITHKWKSSDLQTIYNKISNGTRYKIYVTSCTAYPGGYYNGYLICLSIKEL